MSYEGSENEKARVFLAQLGIDYEGLTKEDLEIRIANEKLAKPKLTFGLPWCTSRP